MPSIFQKDCPECAAANELQALTCACGYSFQSEDSDAADVQQEQLYRDYLAARTVQAEAGLIVAREQLAADPRNAYKGAQALLAEQALNTARAQLEAHCLRAAKPKSAYQAAAVVVAKIAPTKATEVAAPAVTRPATPLADVRSTVSAAPMPIKMVATAPAPKATPAPLVSAGAAKPDEVFKRLQAAKAQAALRSQKAVPHPTPAKLAPTLPTKPVAPVAMPTKSVTPSKQECPNCTAAVAANATGCRCGYAFPTSSHEVPALALDANALAVLNEVLSPTAPRKSR